ncbi:hypothetical protein [Allomuricauda sp. SCSIO 65647]|uniref:hypothetical protein n=1 Tax=Allomuricauda sp. SCSIO 65647 TaxID=2908843 RepID=UPI001F334066|nr:hypothetical protein [Muricauda sp. SCSIO 65647]UJH67377.1 hypothetical protein L0P89_15685 [Muricauda sp. SCSIO 65647]
MKKNNLIEKIDEALASKNTSESDKQLLNEIRQELINASSKEEIIAVVFKLIELFGIFISSTMGSG